MKKKKKDKEKEKENVKEFNKQFCKDFLIINLTNVPLGYFVSNINCKERRIA